MPQTIKFQNFGTAFAIAQNVTVEVEAARSVADLIEVSVSPSKNLYDLTYNYYYWFPVPGTLTSYTKQTIAPGDFIRWTDKTYWYPAVQDDAIAVYGNATATREIQLVDGSQRLVTRVEINKTVSAIAGGSFLFTGRFNRPPSLYFKSNSMMASLRVRDSKGDDYYWNLPNTSGNWQLFTPRWENYDSGAIAQPSDGAIQAIEVVGRDIGSGSFSFFYLGEPPEILPFPVVCYKLAIASRMTAPHSFQIGDVRVNNSPLAKLKGQPGVVPYLVNTSDRVITAWHGEALVGYQSPEMWRQWGDDSKKQQVLDFLAEAQNVYASQSTAGVVGPFAPGYEWTLWGDGIGLDFNKWKWNLDDPFAWWHGYQYRPLAEVAKCWMSDRKNLVAQNIVTRYLTYLDQTFRANNSAQPPTDFPPQSAPQINYHAPESSALILQTALCANIAGASPEMTFRVIRRSLIYLNSQYVSSGTMAGTWSAGQPQFTGQDGRVYRQYSSYWNGEIMSALSDLVKLKPQITYPPCSAQL